MVYDVHGLEGIDPAVAAYHERTKHSPFASAPGPGYMDWATQPDPFRRYAGATLVSLPLPPEGDPFPYEALYERDVAPQPISVASISRFFRLALSLTAWKEVPGARWALRANPSSGNLHPTEGYAVLPPVEGLHPRAAVWHYAPKEHGLERRAEVGWSPPGGTLLVGLSSIPWREAWKYGERAWRYCQHDIGHAIGAMRFAAAANGWRLRLLDGCGSEAVSRVLGLRTTADAEAEEPDLLAIVDAGGEAPTLSEEVLRAFDAASWEGTPNHLSKRHSHEWRAVDEVSRATMRPAGEVREDLGGLPSGADLLTLPPRGSRLTAERAILGRRSAVAMDGKTAIMADRFLGMLARTVATREGAAPFDALPWRPRIHLAMFVHRVAGLAPGLYALVRDPARLDALRAEMRATFAWTAVAAGLPFYFLEGRDARDLASMVSCEQEIAGDGAFSLGMFADFGATLRAWGPWAYARLFWEAGLVGQVLYLEAEEAGVRGTGIG